MKVSKITIGRLYNLGNYEHVRYELTVEIAEGESAAMAMSNLTAIVEALNPSRPNTVKTDSEIKRAEELLAEALAMSPEEFTAAYGSYPGRDTQITTKTKHLETVKRATALWKTRRDNALKALDNLGGLERFTDAKLDWEDYDDNF